MLKRSACLIGLVIVSASASSPADPATNYKELFGREEKKVLATRTRADDLQLAASLLKTAEEITDSPAMQALLCEKTVQFASGDLAGCDMAIRALEILEHAAPDKKPQWLSGKLQIAQFRFSKSAGDDKKSAGQAYMELLEAVAEAKTAEGDGNAARSFYARARNLAAFLKSPRAAVILAKSKRVNAVIARQAKLKSLTVEIKGGKVGLPGKTGDGVSFPAGSKGKLTIPSRVTANLKTFTFAFWVKTTESGSGKVFWSHPTLLGFRTVGGGSRDFGITSNRGAIGYWSGLASGGRDYDHQSTVSINDGKWRHVALTNDGGKMLLYVNGEVVLKKGLPSGALLGTLDVLLGAARSDIADSYGQVNHSGIYDELQVYSRALNQKEIEKIAGKS